MPPTYPISVTGFGEILPGWQSLIVLKSFYGVILYFAKFQTYFDAIAEIVNDVNGQII